MSTFYTILASIISPIIGITVYMGTADRRHEIGKACT